ncbi:hypothetical protein K439DRAFT_1626085 [Ramaria rubella]|nr:hypothetical protein K439DRAFT_1626085 [Ramaria rubella]
MPRIRKKTSKRISTHQRAKFKHKVAEGRKKKKKEAKKNPQWKSKKKKDPGIPNNFPYKDQILAEIADTRRQAEEEKQRRKEEKKAAREGLLVGAGERNDDVNLEDGPSGLSSKSQLEDEAPLLLNPDLPNLNAVLKKADIIIHVLDARDPNSHRLPHMEELAANRKTKLVFVLNKIDLVPRENLVTWVKHLRAQRSTFLFRSASFFLPKTLLNDPKAKAKSKEIVNDSLGSAALLEYLGQLASEDKTKILQVAVVGLTNSGKSALVNSLARETIVPIYAPSSSIDAWTTTTTRAFEAQVEVRGHKINLIDTPGVTLQNEQEPDEKFKIHDMLLRNRGRVDKVKDPVPAVEHIVLRADTQDLMVHYNLPAFAQGDCAAFLAGTARACGLLKKGGDPDLTQAARTVLRDWMTGKLPFYTDVPVVQGGAAPAEDALAALYARADEVVLAAVRTRKEMRSQGELVKIMRGELDTRRVILDASFVVEEGESESEDEENEGEGDEDDDDGEDGSGDDEEQEGDDDEDENEEDIPTPLLTGKRKREVAAAAAPPSKKVAFSVGTQDRREKQQARSAGKRANPTPATKLPKAALTTAPSTSKSSKTAPSKNGKTTPPAITRKTAPIPKMQSSTTTDAYDFDQFFKK